MADESRNVHSVPILDEVASVRFAHSASAAWQATHPRGVRQTRPSSARSVFLNCAASAAESGARKSRSACPTFGIDVVPAGDALAALAETCTLVKRLWDEEKPFDFDGRFHQLSGAVCEPKPVQRPHPPIMIGSGGERHGLRIVAEHADIWSSRRDRPPRPRDDGSRQPLTRGVTGRRGHGSARRGHDAC
jgi:hypothetical protein